MGGTLSFLEDLARACSDHPYGVEILSCMTNAVGRSGESDRTILRNIKRQSEQPELLDPLNPLAPQ